MPKQCDTVCASAARVKLVTLTLACCCGQRDAACRQAHLKQTQAGPLQGARWAHASLQTARASWQGEAACTPTSWRASTGSTSHGSRGNTSSLLMRWGWARPSSPLPSWPPSSMADMHMMECLVNSPYHKRACQAVLSSHDSASAAEPVAPHAHHAVINCTCCSVSHTDLCKALPAPCLALTHSSPVNPMLSYRGLHRFTVQC